MVRRTPSSRGSGMTLTARQCPWLCQTQKKQARDWEYPRRKAGYPDFQTMTDREYGDSAILWRTFAGCPSGGGGNLYGDGAGVSA